MRTARRWAVGVTVICVIIGLTGCGQNDLVLAGVPPVPTPTPTATSNCLGAGATCALASDCCSGSCITLDGVNLTCQ